MKTTIAIATCFLLVLTVATDNLQAQGRQGQRGGKGKGRQAVNQDENAGAQRQNRKRMQNGAGGQQQGGMMGGGQGGMQGGADAARMATMLLTNFDKDGSGALEQVELEQAMMAMMQQMQRMQQMQTQQRMMSGQGMQSRGTMGQGTMGGMVQGACQQDGMGNQYRMRSGDGSGQAGGRQRGGRGGGGKRGR